MRQESLPYRRKRDRDGGKTAISVKETGAVKRRRRFTAPVSLTRKSSKTGKCSAFARLAAFSFQREERAFQKLEDDSCVDPKGEL